MHRRIDDQNNSGQRRVAGEQLSRVIAPGGTPRYDNSDNPISSTLQFPIGYQHAQMVQGQLPQQQPVHAPVAAATLSGVHQGGVASVPTAHPAAPHQGNSGPTPQMGQGQGGLAGPPTGHQQQQQFQRLKVEDALSYLDQVKLQFGNQPSVYNDFLDIMKEFKSQTIDTPGVINRVSNLFKGHPDLIVGFNTFLPPGYKIEVERDVISVLQPGQGSMPISALNAASGAANTSSMAQLQSQRSPAHGLPGANPAHSAAAPNQPSSQPPTVHPYTASTRPPMHGEVPLGSMHGGAASGGGGGAGTQGVVGMAGTSPQTSGTQPVEFNHAINYVNKIKNRFQGQPEVYKQFLEILHTYQKEQRNIKEQGIVGSSNKPLTETEVYSQVARLFADQEDLLAEFGQFLPDANGGGSSIFFTSDGGADGRRPASDMALGVRNDHSSTHKKPASFPSKGTPLGKTTSQLKRPACTNNSSNNASVQPPAKKFKSGILKDVSLAEAGKYGTLKEYAFFDSVRNALRSNEVYNNFLRCLILFNSEIISRSELITMVHPFLVKHCELYNWFKNFLGHKDSTTTLTEPIPQMANKERSVRDDYNMEIDYQSCKRYGASYRALPSTYPQPKCSGRTQLCREVLNDTWVSIPTWSEDSTFVTSRKSQFEEHIYRCEDERFELDVVLETNFAAIKTLETVSRKIQRMSPEEATKFRLDNTLGGTSEFVTRKAICRLYGEKATDIIDGLKKNPVVAVPLVLRRLKAKDEEWRDAQKGFNKVWREQNEKYYLKSLDHQGMTFKQNDIKALRGKSLVNEIETILEETQEANQQGQINETLEPHIKEKYDDKTVFEDAASVVIHHMKRSSSIHHEEKKKIKQLMYHQIRHFLFYPHGELSDDEDENDTDGDNSSNDKKPKEGSNCSAVSGCETPRRTIKQEEKDGWTKENGLDPANSSSRDKLSTDDWHQGSASESMDVDLDDMDDDQYILFFGNTNWYLFNRLHYKLCQRLLHFRKLSDEIAQHEENSKIDRKPSTAMALRLRTPFEVEPAQYYSFFLESIKNLLDCSLESSQYEDNLREMYSINSYTAFTMDKHVQQIVRVLHHLVTEEQSVEMVELYHEETLNNATGGSVSTRHQRMQAELTYQRKAETLVNDDNCYKFVFYKKSGEVHITLLDQGGEQTEDVVDTERWAQYVERYIGMTPTDDPAAQNFNSHLKEDPVLQQNILKQLLHKPVFLSRNIASWRRSNLTNRRGDSEEDEEDLGIDEDTGRGEDGGSGGEDDKKDEGMEHGEGGKVKIKTEQKEEGDQREVMEAAQMAHALEYVNDVNSGQTMIADGGGVRFTVNSLKMHHICWGAEMWYRRGAIYDARQSHKQLSLVKHRKFVLWLKKWLKENVSEDKEIASQDWMMGLVDSIPPSSSTTQLHQVHHVSKPPYYTYHRYHVKRHGPAPSPHSPSTSQVAVPAVQQQQTPANSVAITLASALPSDLITARTSSRPSSRSSSRPSTPAE